MSCVSVRLGWRWRPVRILSGARVRSLGIAGELGVHPEALRTWVKRSEIDGGLRAGTTSADAQRIRELEKENRELWRANEILRKASAYFAQAEPGRR